MIEHALRHLLVNDDAVSDYVDDRVYYVQAIQEVETPYVVMYKVSASRVHSHDGSSFLANPRMQFSIYAKTYLETKSIAEAIQNLLQGYQGVVNVPNYPSVHIQMCLYMNEVDMYETQSELYHVAVDYELYHRELRPTQPYEYEGS